MNLSEEFLGIVREEYPALPATLRFEEGEVKTLKVFRSDSSVWTIRAGDRAGAARGIGFVLAGMETEESTPFKTMGVMIDCSRNRVPTVAFLKRHFLRLALMGYNFALLYTEDTYRLPGEPRFGYMRGAYSMEEIRELDAFARKVGIELSACIQTLGHLAQILRWGAYDKVRDARDVLLVDEPETRRLIEKMIRFWSEALTSKRIHIGMDEVHDLGRGKYMDLHGAQDAFELFNRHLAMVSELCAEKSLKPVIWSDMYFRLGSKTRDYYDRESVIPESVRRKIPSSVRLCYWDYVHRTPDFYEDYIRKHRELGSEPVFASGIWTWFQFWYDHEWTRATLVPGVEACRKTGLEEMFFTMWGDNGGYCIPESALAGLEFASGVAWGGDPDAAEPYSGHMRAVCGMDYRLFLELSRVAKHYWNEWPDIILEENILWDDPLYGMGYNAYLARSAEAVADYRGVLKDLSALLEKKRFSGEEGFALKVLAALIRVLSMKFDYQEAVFQAYEQGNKERLARIAEEDIPEYISALETFDLLFRENWLKHSKPFGLEVIQRRNAGVAARLREASRRIGDYLSGRIPGIPEFDAALEARGTFDPSFQQFYSGSSNI